MRGFPLLDGYRGIASLLVLTTHVAFSTAFIVQGPLGAATARFDIGVSIFFLLSGFLLYRRWALAALTGGERPRTGPYLRRRLWRILPAYWLVVIAVVLFLPTVTPTLTQVLSNLGLVQVYWEGNQLFGLTQMWSLAVELAFYLALPVIGWVTLRRSSGDVDLSFRWQSRLLAVCWLIGTGFTIFRFAALPGYHTLGFWLPGFLDWFALGMAAALASARLGLPDPPRALVAIRRLADDTWTCLVAAAALFVVLCTPIGGPYVLTMSDPLGEVIRHIGYPIVALLFLLPGFLGSPSNGLWQRFLTHPGMQFLGAVSYGIFLWHLLVRDALIHYLGIQEFSGGFAWLWPATVAITCVLAWFSWVLVERPAITYSHGPSVLRRVRRPRRRNPETAPPDTAASATTIPSDSTAPTHTG